MYELDLDKAKLKTVKSHHYYVFFPAPTTHKNQENRPTEYANEKDLKTYKGVGSNGSAKLLPEVFNDANSLMSSMREYGQAIDDWSLRSAVIQSGYRPDDASQGRNYLRIIKQTIDNHPKIFGSARFPENLEADAQGVLGRRGDPRRTAFQRRVAEAPGWSRALAQQLFQIVDNAYAPRGSNPHATGLVFDLDFSIYYNGGELQLGAATKYNNAALQSAAGSWINKYATQFGFDSYDTGAEVWHLEYRKPQQQ